MAKQRYINTKIWEDAWFASLDQIEQLVFIYFLTNPMTNIIGAYELSKGTIGRSVGLDVLMLDEILKRFSEAKKVLYVDGWVILPNFIKHQNYKSPKIKKGIENELENVPEHIRTLILESGGYGIDTLSHLIKSNLIKSNINTGAKNGAGKAKKPKIKKESKYSVQGADILKAFEEIDVKNKTYYNNKTQREACDFLIREYGFDQVISLIPKLKSTNTKSVYQITTPWEMKEKITKVFNDVKRKTSETQNKGRGFI